MGTKAINIHIVIYNINKYTEHKAQNSASAKGLQQKKIGNTQWKETVCRQSIHVWNSKNTCIQSQIDLFANTKLILIHEDT